MEVPRTSRLVLASASPRRSDLLRAGGWAFVVRPAHLDEDRWLDPARPRETVLDVARAKASATSRAPDELVLAADTIVVGAGGSALGKPADLAEARRHLERLSGTTHFVLTAVVLLGAHVEHGHVEETRVTMRRLTEGEIDAYVASGEGLGKAGGYAIQEHADAFVTAVEGSWSNVVGLPMEVVDRLLRDLGLGPTASVERPC